ncbi:MAG TPA: helix-hairpin-helix domain-containing protein [Thermoanaerobaculia bacterium]|jgi:competence protein ComEA|nr:helix-hairpin-helix domain-containing protein [Thermoanaerobaculia bacterium]
MNLNRRLVGILVLVGILLASLSFAAETRRVVNVNTADTSQLALLPRVGPAVAQRIVTFRKENGPFKSPEDLMLVQGIGEKTYQLIKPYVAVSGETTLKEKVKASKAAAAPSPRPAPKEGSR